jgi:hypothetical protein
VLLLVQVVLPVLVQGWLSPLVQVTTEVVVSPVAQHPPELAVLVAAPAQA